MRPPAGVDARPRPDARAERVFRAAVAHETLLAREAARDLRFDPNDPRWRIALETSRRIQGGLLAFEDRRRLLAMATRLGIRPFDANLIVALVQDRARRGEPVENAAATIALVPRPAGPDRADQPSRRRDADGADRTRSDPARLDPARLLVAAVLVAGAFDAMLIAWMMFG